MIEAIIAISTMLFILYPIGKIIEKAGYSFWWCLIVLGVPAGFILLYIFAFSKWPIEKELQEMKAI